jgi:hypothetical protein
VNPDVVAIGTLLITAHFPESQEHLQRKGRTTDTGDKKNKRGKKCKDLRKRNYDNTKTDKQKTYGKNEGRNPSRRLRKRV